MLDINEFPALDPKRFAMEATQRCEAHAEAAWSVAWTVQDKIISGGVDETVGVRDTKLLLTHQFAGHQMGCVSVDTDARGSILATSSIDCVVRLFDLEAGQSLGEIDAGPVESWKVSVSPDGEFVAAGTHGGNINVWRLTGEKVATIDCSESFTMDVAFNADGSMLAAASLDGSVRVFDVATATRVYMAKDHKGTVRCVSWGGEGILYSSSDDTRCLAYDRKSNSFSSQFTRHTNWCCAGRACGNFLATCSADRRVNIWDIRKHDVVCCLEHHDDQIWDVAWSPDGKGLISCGDDAAIQMYAECEPPDLNLPLCYQRVLGLKPMPPAKRPRLDEEVSMEVEEPGSILLREEEEQEEEEEEEEPAPAPAPAPSGGAS
ncbi:hypothetical protein CTAYLR_002098 [Chrysophaeum taylorii]|uniref:Anaphase-promoting complex subunit 4-like WD40 domain-containing protein n=1 Tax=Chrysophaeum taylorii TaxID=2483200 RepID=A0AAD7UNU7_9STRA|nr:hypothetical protein CTAYLR_002098 [Chrysophaeum taylorii]